jgi:hypothetical protein
MDNLRGVPNERQLASVTPFKDECGICGRVLSSYRLKKCERCKRLFCRDCMVPDVTTGDTQTMLCLHCARRVVSPRIVSKYDGLARHLKFRAAFTNVVKLGFARIDGLIGSNLPMEAYRDESWWSNSPSTAHAKSWLDVGWEVQEVNLKEGIVTFKKVRELPRVRGCGRRRTNEISEPFTPVPVRPLKSKVPSKTKASKLYARILNLERQRNAARCYAKGLKPRSQYEKKLFKSDEKPR